MTNRSFPFLSVLLAGVLASVKPGWATEPVAATLPNGLRLIVQSDASSRIVAVDAFVKLGADRESRVTAGARNFLQTAMLRGTTRRSAAQIAEELAGRGATLNMGVDDDYVEFYATGGVNSWDYLTTLMGEILRHPALRDRDLEDVRTVLLNQVASRHDRPGRWAYQLFRETLYTDSRGEPAGYGLDPLGYDDSLRRLSRASLRDFHRQYYVPNNIVLCVVGAVRPDEVRTRVGELFKNFAKRTVPPSEAPQPPAPPDHTAVRERKTDLTWLVLGYPAPAVTERDYPAARVASALLGEGMASRLYAALREKMQVAYDLANFCPMRARSGNMATYVAIQPLKDDKGRVADLRLEETRQAIVAEYERLKKEPVAEAELTRAKNYVIGTFALNHERTREKAWQLGRFECMGVGYGYDRRFPELVRRVTSADIQKLAATWFHDPTAAVIMPQALP